MSRRVLTVLAMARCVAHVCGDSTATIAVAADGSGAALGGPPPAAAAAAPSSCANVAHYRGGEDGRPVRTVYLASSGRVGSKMLAEVLTRAGLEARRRLTHTSRVTGRARGAQMTQMLRISPPAKHKRLTPNGSTAAARHGGGARGAAHARVSRTRRGAAALRRAERAGALSLRRPRRRRALAPSGDAPPASELESSRFFAAGAAPPPSPRRRRTCALLSP